MRRAQDRARSATFKNSGAWSATIKLRALGELKLARDEHVPAKRADFFFFKKCFENDQIRFNWKYFVENSNFEVWSLTISKPTFKSTIDSVNDFLENLRHCRVTYISPLKGTLAAPLLCFAVRFSIRRRI